VSVLTVDSLGQALLIAAAIAALLLLSSPYLSPAIVRARARRLPHPLAERLGEEWLAELAAIDGRAARLTFAISLLLVRNRSLEPSASGYIWVEVPETDFRVYTDYSDRIIATVVDGVVEVLLVGALMLLFQAIHVPAPRPVWLLLSVLGTCYVYCVLRFGGSPGKILMKLRIVTVDGGPLTLRHALLRISPTLLQLVLSTAFLFAAEAAAGSHLDGLPAAARRAAIAAIVPLWVTNTIGVAFNLYALADLSAFLSTDHRRSLRDIIAGTVVILRAPKTIEVPADPPPVTSTSMFR
jgi:uncharacterized RDD family membrane protein YckC